MWPFLNESTKHLCGSLMAEQCRSGSALQTAPFWLKGIPFHLFKRY